MFHLHYWQNSKKSFKIKITSTNSRVKTVFQEMLMYDLKTEIRSTKIAEDTIHDSCFSQQNTVWYDNCRDSMSTTATRICKSSGIHFLTHWFKMLITVTAKRQRTELLSFRIRQMRLSCDDELTFLHSEPNYSRNLKILLSTVALN